MTELANQKITSALEQTINILSIELEKLPRKLLLFSLGLMSLYAENAMGSTSNNATKINTILDNTRKDALLYVAKLLPLCSQVVRFTQEFFEFYGVLDLDKWTVCLPVILDEVRRYKQGANTTVQMHNEILIPLKKRQDEASILIHEIADLNIEFQRKKNELEEYANMAYTWANVLSYVPGVNLIVPSLLGMKAENDISKLIAEGQQIKINDAAIVVIRDDLFQSISQLIDSITAVAGFFNVVEEEITSFQSKEGKATEDTKKLHYTMMKTKEMEIKDSCKKFYAMIPRVQTDILSLPEHPDDQNYVDKWLIKKHVDIEKKYHANVMTGS